MIRIETLAARSYGLAGGLLLVGLLLPATRHLAIETARAEALAGNPAPTSTQQHAYALKYPDDFEIQFGEAARLDGWTVGDIEFSTAMGSLAPGARLEALLPRFGSHPEVHMALLRPAILARDREPAPSPRKSPIEEWKSRPWDPVERRASAGEAVDPDNACFPFWRAISLFALGKREEGDLCLGRAARKPHWHSYERSESRAALALREAVEGPLPLAERAASVVPNQSVHVILRAAGQQILALSQEDEREGRIQAGIARRHALIQIGCLISADGEPVIESLTGEPVAQAGAGTPGTERDLSYAEVTALRKAHPHALPARRYRAFLVAHGEAREANWVLQKFQELQERHNSIRKALPAMSQSLRNIESAHRCWHLALLLFSCGALLVLLWGWRALRRACTPSVSTPAWRRRLTAAALASAILLALLIRSSALEAKAGQIDRVTSAWTCGSMARDLHLPWPPASAQ